MQAIIRKREKLNGVEHQRDPLTYVRDVELLGLVMDLDGVFDVLLGQALSGSPDFYDHALVVRAAADFIAETRAKVIS